MSEKDEIRARGDHYSGRRYDVEHESEAYVLERQRQQRRKEDEARRSSAGTPSYFGGSSAPASGFRTRSHRPGLLGIFGEISLPVIIGAIVIALIVAKIMHL